MATGNPTAQAQQELPLAPDEKRLKELEALLEADLQAARAEMERDDQGDVFIRSQPREEEERESTTLQV